MPFGLRIPVCLRPAASRPSAPALPFAAGRPRKAPGISPPSLLRLLLLAFLALLPCLASAQVTYGGDAPIATGFNTPASLAEDNFGDIFLSDLSGTIYWFAPDSAGKYASYTTIASGVSDIQYLSVNAEGSLLFVDITDGSTSSLRVYEKNSGAFSLLKTVAPGPAAAFPIAVDSTSNIAVTDANNSVLYFGNYNSLPTSNFSNLGVLGYMPTYAAAVSPDDNIFLAGQVGTTYGMAEFEKTGSNSWTPLGPASMEAFSSDIVQSLALDGFSNLYAAIPGTNSIVEMADTHDINYSLSSALGSLTANYVGADRFGNLAHIDTSSGTLSVDVRYPAIDFGTVAVGSSTTKSLFVTVTAATAEEAGLLINNLVVAPATSDYSESVPSTTCLNTATNTWFCGIPIAFSPQGPGYRTDSVSVLGPGGSVLTTVYLSGKGTGPLGVLGFGETIIGQAGTALNGITLQSATGVAADPQGNIYVLDQTAAKVIKYTRTGSGTYTGKAMSITGISLTTPGLNYIAVDGAGNIYTDQGTSIVKIDSSGAASTMSFGITLGAVSGLFADSYGTLHISDNVNSQVVMVPALGSGVVEKSSSGAKFAGLVNEPGSFLNLASLAYAPFGPTFAVETQSQKIDEFGFPVGGYQFSFSYSPRQLAFDTAGNIVFANAATSSYVAYNPTASSTFSLPISPPAGCAPDSLIQTEAGDYVASSSACGEVIVYPAQSSASLAFNPTQTGATSSDSPKTLNLYNIGTDPLAFSVPASGTNPSISTNFLAGAGDTCPSISSGGASSSVASESSCTLSVSFQPQSAGSPLTGSLAITDNNLNQTGAVQTVSLSGDAGTAGILGHFGVTPTNSTAYAGVPDTLTITAYDQLDNVLTTFSGTVVLSSSDASATFSTFTFSNGVATGTVTFQTLGTQQVNVSGGGATGQSSNITVESAPSFVVTNTNDSGVGSLRAALDSAATAGAGDITFDLFVFSASNSAAANTITITSGTLNIPSYTTITGRTSGTGTGIQNLVTIAGASVNNGFPLFSVASGVVNATLANVTLSQAGSINAGGIDNAGSLVFQNSTITGMDGSEAGAIYNHGGGTMEIVDCTISANISGHYGAALNSDSGAVTVIATTMTGNSALFGAAGILVTGGTASVSDSTITGNFAGMYGVGIYNTHGTLAIANSIVSGNRLGTSASPGNYDDLDDQSGATSFTTGNNGGNLVGYYNANSVNAPTPAVDLATLGSYGGPTQTMVPLPGSPAICAAAVAGVPSGTTTDQRGYPLQPTGGYCPSGTIDTGATQTNYTSLSFLQQPTNVAIGSAMSPAPTVQVIETDTLLVSSNTDVVNVSGLALSSSNFTLSDSGSVLENGFTESTTGGTIELDGLTFSALDNSDSLTAKLVVYGTNKVSGTSNSFSVGQATPTLTVTDAGGTYSGSAFPAACTVTGLSGVPGSTLEGVSLTLAYYAGSTVSGSPLAGAPSDAGTYTAQCTFPGSTNYISTSNTAVFTIDMATPTLTWNPAKTIIWGDSGTGVLNASVNCTLCGSIEYAAAPSVGKITSTSGLAVGAYTIGAGFLSSSGNYNNLQLTSPLTVSGESVWLVNSGGSTAELAGNGDAISSSAFSGANLAAAINAAGDVWTIGAGATPLEATSQIGAVKHTVTSGGGLDTPSGLAVDGNSRLWIANSGNNSVSLFLNDGSAESPSTGFTDSSLSSPSGIAVDLGGSVWISNQKNNSITRILGAAAPAAPPSTAAKNNTTGAKP